MKHEQFLWCFRPSKLLFHWPEQPVAHLWPWLVSWFSNAKCVFRWVFNIQSDSVAISFDPCFSWYLESALKRKPVGVPATVISLCLILFRQSLYASKRSSSQYGWCITVRNEMPDWGTTEKVSVLYNPYKYSQLNLPRRFSPTYSSTVLFQLFHNWWLSSGSNYVLY